MPKQMQENLIDGMKARAPQRSKRRKLFIAAIVLFSAMAVFSAGCLVVFSMLGKTLVAQQTAEIFGSESEERFAQVSVFFPIGQEADEARIYAFREVLERKFVEASMQAEEGHRFYVDAYSSRGTVSIEGARGSATASAIGVGGEFFTLHPLFLRSGGYLSERDLMRDRVVLDEELAWRLFGGVDLAGEEVYISGERFIVVGVISREGDFASLRAYADGMGLFMSYEALNRLSGAKIGCYEIVCINPVSGFAAGLVSDHFQAASVVENSARYTASGIMAVIKSFGERSMNTAGVVYPYWENAARLIEDYMALCLLLAIIFAVPAVVFAIAVGIFYWIKFYRRLKAKVPELIDERSERRYEKRQRQKKGSAGDEQSEAGLGEENGKCDLKEHQESVR